MPTWTGALALIASAVFAGAVSFRALFPPTRGEDPAVDPEPFVPTLPAPDAAADREALARILASAEWDPFHPERRRPATDQAADVLVEPGPGEEATDLEIVLLGTVVGRGQGFVVCRAATISSRIVRVGDRCGGLSLVAVHPRRAEFADDTGRRVVIELSGRRRP